MKNMKHKYLADIDTDLWNQLENLKQLEQTSINALLVRGARQLIRDRVSEIAQMRKTRNSLHDMVSA